MPKVVWNGGFEIDWKTISFILWAVFITGGAWYKLSALEDAFTAHLAASQVKSDQLTVLGIRVDTMEMRVDGCCPYVHAQVDKEAAGDYTR